MEWATYRGRVVAAVAPAAFTSPLGWMRARPAIRSLVFVAFTCAFALEVRLGRVRGRHDDERAALFARFALIDDAAFGARAGWV